MRDDVNKRLCELLGDCWHEKTDYDDECSCGMQWMGPQYARGINKHIKESNHDFFSEKGRIDLLKRLKENGCFYEFFERYAFASDFAVDLLDDNGALARAALEFLEASHEP